uniref:Uncharacterized protein n=1 Tax=Anguilla anguilla TaxID=7936 RepID=A0A0E9SKR6_ANGAN
MTRAFAVREALPL